MGKRFPDSKERRQLLSSRYFLKPGGHGFFAGDKLGHSQADGRGDGGHRIDGDDGFGDRLTTLSAYSAARGPGFLAGAFVARFNLIWPGC